MGNYLNYQRLHKSVELNERVNGLQNEELKKFIIFANEIVREGCKKLNIALNHDVCFLPQNIFLQKMYDYEGGNYFFSKDERGIDIFIKNVPEMEKTIKQKFLDFIGFKSDYKEEKVLKTLIHEIIHSHQAYKIRDGKEHISFFYDTNVKREKFVGLVEFGTELLTIKISDEMSQERKEKIKNVISTASVIQSDIYIEKYGKVINLIIDFFQETLKMERDKIENIFFQSLLSGTIKKEYRKLFLTKYGSKSFKMLSYLGSNDKKRQKEELYTHIVRFFGTDVSSQERIKLAQDCEKIAGY